MIEIITIILGISLFLTHFIYYLMMMHYSKKEKNWENDELFLKISIIIPTYNEETTIINKMENIFEIDYPKELLEMVIIDSGSTDKTVKLIERFIYNHPDIRVVFLREVERLGKSHAINIAYAKSTGEIKIISDADSLLNRNSIKYIIRNFKDPTIGAVRGRQILINPEKSFATKLEKSFRDISEMLRMGESIFDSTPIFCGELSAYRSDLIEPLPENKSADDTRLANIIRRKGYRIVYDEDAVFYEYAPPTFRARYIQKVRRAQGLIRLFWDFKDVLFRVKYGMYGLVIMPIEFFVHCISPILFIFFLGFSLITISQKPVVFLLYLGGLIFLLVFSFVKNRLFTDGIKINISKIIVNFVNFELILLIALLLSISGKSLHKWQKVEEIRAEWFTNAS